MNTGTLEREMYEQYNRGMASAGGFYLKVGGGEHGRQLVRITRRHRLQEPLRCVGVVSALVSNNRQYFALRACMNSLRIAALALFITCY